MSIRRSCHPHIARTRERLRTPESLPRITKLAFLERLLHRLPPWPRRRKTTMAWLHASRLRLPYGWRHATGGKLQALLDTRLPVSGQTVSVIGNTRILTQPKIHFDTTLMIISLKCLWYDANLHQGHKKFMDLPGPPRTTPVVDVFLANRSKICTAPSDTPSGVLLVGPLGPFSGTACIC